MKFIRLRMPLRFTMKSTKNGRLDFFFIQIGDFKMNPSNFDRECKFTIFKPLKQWTYDAFSTNQENAIFGKDRLLEQIHGEGIIL